MTTEPARTPRDTGARRRWGVVLASVSLVCTALLVPAYSAGAAASATMKGTVTSSGAPLAGVTVVVLKSSAQVTMASGVTNSLGRYQLTVPASVALKVKFAKSGYLTNFSAQKSTFETATVYTLAAGTTRTLPTQTMTREAVIQGQILSWMDPLSGAKVTVWNATTNTVIRSVQLGPSVDTYRIGGLPAVKIKVQASKQGYQDAWAGPYQLHAGQVLKQSWDPMILYLDLTPGAVVSGHVVGVNNDPFGHGYDGPLGGVTVRVFDAVTNAVLSSATTIANPSAPAFGDYTVTGIVSSHPVKIRFSAPGWATDYYLNKSSRAQATTMTLVPGTYTTLAQQTIYSLPAIQGQVLSWMDPLGGARVTVYNAATSQVIGTKLADGDGNYRFDNLPVVQVKVGASKAGYEPDFANNRPSLAQANVFQLLPGRTLAQSWDPVPFLYLDLAPLP